MGINNTTTINGMFVNDVKLAHILGIPYENLRDPSTGLNPYGQPGKIYLFNQTPTVTTITQNHNCVIFEKKMYINMYRQLNLFCTQMSYPGLTAAQ